MTSLSTAYYERVIKMQAKELDTLRAKLRLVHKPHVTGSHMSHHGHCDTFRIRYDKIGTSMYYVLEQKTFFRWKYIYTGHTVSDCEKIAHNMSNPFYLRIPLLWKNQTK